MITNNDINQVNLSTTRKDFYQIWNELLDTAGKISERWDPASTNESDPGIVLLKVLTAIADKINYNIDKNILEAFMPSAAQIDSMHKLCDMMGYNMKYYQSATTEATIAYIGQSDLLPTEGLTIPRFTVLTNIDNDITYVTTEQRNMTAQIRTVTVPCIQGEAVRCETENDNIISVNQLDDNNKFYLPESQIAENGIFVFSIEDNVKSGLWEKVDNLNTQSIGSSVYKFGFNSKTGRPYLEFPQDIASIIKDGLEIWYIRTRGAMGNISARTLSKLEKPSSWSDMSFDVATDFQVVNPSATFNGAAIETIDQAYNNYKKTIGTFDTLVTCRDYMNKIYSLMDDQNIPYVSNVIVSDIRDDINRAVTLCSFNEYGIFYKERAIEPPKDASGKTREELRLNNFDLMLYPFKTVKNLNTKSEYVNSFKYSSENANGIETEVADIKTIAHSFKLPEQDEIVCIKNYMRLHARITTTYKVNTIEEKNILDNIKANIYKKFNLRQIDFSEEIPFDSILACMEEADERVKNVSLDDPILYTRFLTASGKEYDTAATTEEKVIALMDAAEKASYDKWTESQQNTYIAARIKEAKKIYNKLALKNILAGRLELFNYDNNFNYELDESLYKYNDSTGTQTTYAAVYPVNEDDPPIKSIKSECLINIPDEGFPKNDQGDPELKLRGNEVIQFRAPNFITKITYPAYVNYYLELEKPIAEGGEAIPATMQTIREYLSEAEMWDDIANYYQVSDNKLTEINVGSRETFDAYTKTYGRLFYVYNNKFQGTTSYRTSTTCYYLGNSAAFTAIDTIIKSKTGNDAKDHFKGLYRAAQNTSSILPYGKLVDKEHVKYLYCTTDTSASSLTTAWPDYYFVQKMHNNEVKGENGYTKDGIGRDRITNKIPANSEYELIGSDKLYINYVPSSDSETQTSASKNIIYKAGTIIRPNFELEDSATLYASGVDYDKTFERAPFAENTNIEAMYTFGPSEQVEIRNQAKVILSDNITFIYWNILNAPADGTFPTTDLKLINNKYSYILKEGEYFYYTDVNKIDMAYYGAGSEIIFSNKNVIGQIKKDVKETEISSDDILNYGIGVIPWIRCNFNASKDNIEIKEYQYITLTEGDSLNKIRLQDSTEGTPEKTINNTWKAISTYTKNDSPSDVLGMNDVTYTILNEKYTLPQINTTSASWEVRSKLEFNTSPVNSQVLYNLGKIKYEGTTKTPELILQDSITLYKQNGTTLAEIVKLKPKLEINSAGDAIVEAPLSIKTNYLLQTTLDTIDTSVTSYFNEADKDALSITDFKVKVFETTTLNQQINIVNFGENWHSVVLDKSDSETEADKADFQITIPQNCYGLIMMYCINNSATTTNDSNSLTGAYLTGKFEGGELGKELTIYNNLNSSGESFGWWNGLTETVSGTVRYYLKNNAINVIRIPSSGSMTLQKNCSNTVGVIYGTLDIIKYTAENTTGINQDLIRYFSIDTEDITTDKSASDQLLKDIRELDTDHKFYYNCIVDNSIALNINRNLSEEERENLATARIWYDYNNINNKFVVSEIDADELSTGIVLARTSKL